VSVIFEAGPNDDVIDESRKHIVTALNNCWAKLDKYYKLMDDSPAYGAALVLHPGHKWKFLSDNGLLVISLTGWISIKSR
jgi:hypothetical protein